MKLLTEFAHQLLLALFAVILCFTAGVILYFTGHQAAALKLANLGPGALFVAALLAILFAPQKARRPVSRDRLKNLLVRPPKNPKP